MNRHIRLTEVLISSFLRLRFRWIKLLLINPVNSKRSFLLMPLNVFSDTICMLATAPLFLQTFQGPIHDSRSGRIPPPTPAEPNRQHRYLGQSEGDFPVIAGVEIRRRKQPFSLGCQPTEPFARTILDAGRRSQIRCVETQKRPLRLALGAADVDPLSISSQL